MDIEVTDTPDGVRSVLLSRPAKRNSLTVAMYGALTATLRDAAENPAARAVLLTGGPDCFTAGNDLHDFRDRAPHEGASPALAFLDALRDCPRPVIAAVGGVAVGIGTTLLLHCDLAYATQEATFRLPFVDLGLCPEAASSLLLPLRAGPALAAELLLLGEPFDAPTALRANLINAVLPAPDLLAHATARARALAQKPPAALATTKALLRRWTRGRTTDALAEEAEHFRRLLDGPEAREALAAFAERRAPDFSRRAQE